MSKTQPPFPDSQIVAKNKTKTPSVESSDGRGSNETLPMLPAAQGRRRYFIKEENDPKLSTNKIKLKARPWYQKLRE